MNVRIAKNSKTPLNNITFNMKLCLISMNPTEEIDYKILNDKINSKPEWKRRFYLHNMSDDLLRSIYKDRTQYWTKAYQQIVAREF